MRTVVFVAVLIASLAATSIQADSAKTTAIPTPAVYSTSETDIGTLLDNPAARAIVDKHIPGFSNGDQIDMARAMTLKSVQQFAPDAISDQALADIDAELAKLPARR